MNNGPFVFWNNLNTVEYFKKKPHDHRVEKKLSEIKNSKEMNALDLGCGGGRHTELLCKKDFFVYSVDINPEMIKATKKRVKKIKNQPKFIGKGSILNIPFCSDFFDVIIATGVLHQGKGLIEYELAIRELSRVIKENGVICLNVFTNKILDETYVKKGDDEFSYITKEGLPMCLLDKNTFYKLMKKYNLILTEELSEDIKQESTGPRAVLRCNFKKMSIFNH